MNKIEQKGTVEYHLRVIYARIFLPNNDFLLRERFVGIFLSWFIRVDWFICWPRYLFDDFCWWLIFLAVYSMDVYFDYLFRDRIRIVLSDYLIVADILRIGLVRLRSLLFNSLSLMLSFFQQISLHTSRSLVTIRALWALIVTRLYVV